MPDVRPGHETRGMAPVLVAGLPRSGTTWVGDLLRHGGPAEYLFEPDNEKTSPMGWEAKRGMHRFPYLRAGDHPGRYREFWQAALFGRVDRWRLHSLLRLLWRARVQSVEREIGEATGVSYAPSGARLTEARHPPQRARANALWATLARATYDPTGTSEQGARRLVKSVHCILALDWLVKNFRVQCVVVLRNPHALFASYKRMSMPDRFRNLLCQPNLRDDLADYAPHPRTPIGEDDEIAFQIALSYSIVAAQARVHPEWLLISHDRLCVDPTQAFSTLFEALGMTWGADASARLVELDQHGSGYAARRRTAEQPTKWRSDVTDTQRATIERWIDAFGLKEFLRECVTA